jgi:hypothetical protein
MKKQNTVGGRMWEKDREDDDDDDLEVEELEDIPIHPAQVDDPNNVRHYNPNANEQARLKQQ